MVVGAIVGLGILLCVFWLTGSVSGREFNPSTWATRSFTYTRNPFTMDQWSGIEHDAFGLTLDADILKLVTAPGPIPPPSTRWDLWDIRSGSGVGVGEARILWTYLYAPDSRTGTFWTRWTHENPTAAPVLWSAVRDCVHLPRYDQLPAIFEVARTHTDSSELKRAIEPIMVRMSLETGRSSLKAGDKAQATRAGKLGLEYISDSKSAEGVELSEMISD